MSVFWARLVRINQCKAQCLSSCSGAAAGGLSFLPPPKIFIALYMPIPQPPKTANTICTQSDRVTPESQSSQGLICILGSLTCSSFQLLMLVGCSQQFTLASPCPTATPTACIDPDDVTEQIAAHRLARIRRSKNAARICIACHADLQQQNPSAACKARKM